MKGTLPSPGAKLVMQPFKKDNTAPSKKAGLRKLHKWDSASLLTSIKGNVIKISIARYSNENLGPEFRSFTDS